MNEANLESEEQGIVKETIAVIQFANQQDLYCRFGDTVPQNYVGDRISSASHTQPLWRHNLG